MLVGCSSLDLGTLLLDMLVLMGFLRCVMILMVLDRLGGRYEGCRGAKFVQTLFQIACLARHAEFSARS